MAAVSTFTVALEDDAGREVRVTRTPSAAMVWIDGREHRAVLRPDGRCFELSLEDRTERVWIAVAGDDVYVHAFGRARTLHVTDPFEHAQRDAGGDDVAKAPTPGTLLSIAVSPGDEVTERQVLAVIESMKMQSEIVAWRDGVVERVHLQAGESFEFEAALVTLAALDAGEEAAEG